MQTRDKQIEKIKAFGISTHNLTYEQCVDKLIEMYSTVTDALEYDEKERFSKELLRITKTPTN